METSFQDRLLSFAKANFLVLGLLSAGLIFLGIGVVQILGTQKNQIKFEKGADIAGVSSEAGSRSAGKTSGIKVDVEGEVLRPGLYTLNSDARVQDALIAAGGLSTSANRKSINLAARIADGQKIYVAAIGEEIPAGLTLSGGGSAAGPEGLWPGGVSINSASQSQLEELPSIGPVTAQKIIDGRPYAALDELVNKKSVGQKTFEKIKDLISL